MRTTRLLAPLLSPLILLAVSGYLVGPTNGCPLSWRFPALRGLLVGSSTAQNLLSYFFSPWGAAFTFGLGGLALLLLIFVGLFGGWRNRQGASLLLISGIMLSTSIGFFIFHQLLLKPWCA